MFISGFNRDRDFYQLPLALAENNLLETFVTDYYYETWLKIPNLRHRSTQGLSGKKVKNTYSSILSQFAWKYFTSHLGKSLNEVKIDQLISNKITKIAKKSDSDLFLYNGFAGAFSHPSSIDKAKILFQFHPTPIYVSEKLNLDQKMSTIQFRVPEPEIRNLKELSRRNEIEYQLANHIVCASHVTRESLIRVGVDKEKIEVIPYGYPSYIGDRGEKSFKNLKFIFVGSGGRRKGLHHLLQAFSKFQDKYPSTLTVISRNLDPGLNLANLKNVKYVPGLAKKQLEQELISSDILVLPSLVEGFGLVITEALSAGCHILASRNTCLPDLNLSEILATTIEEEISAKTIEDGMEIAARKVLANRDAIQEESKIVTSEYQWIEYRKRIAASARIQASRK